MSIRHLLWLGFLVGGVLGMTSEAGAEARKQTYTFKKVGSLEIKADVWREADQKVRPVVVWMHGGALINGNREGVSRRLQEAMLEAGYILVSLDYRLAPETQLPEIISDLEDGLLWIHDQGPELFQADSDRIAVTGGSAGGYLTLVAGYRAKHRPVALLAFWGYGDLVGDWYSTPSPHPRHNAVKVTAEKAREQVAGKPVADHRDRQGDGGLFYNYCRQTGTWPKAVSGWDPHQTPEKFYPYMPVKNVNKDYPPAFLIHGDRDTDVPYEQSTLMVAEFKKQGVPHKLVTIKNGEHGLEGGDKQEIEAAYLAAFAFLREHLDRK